MIIKSSIILRKVGISFIILVGLLISVFTVGLWKFNKSFFHEKPEILSFKSAPIPMKFQWANENIGEFYEEKTAIVIPAQLPDLNQQFYLQFDTGSPYSFIYEKGLESLKELGITFEEEIINEERYLKNFGIILGGNPTFISKIKIYENYGSSFSENDSTKYVSIGTIGSDFLSKKVTAIDFESQYIQFYKSRPDWMDGLSGFKKFSFAGRRVMLPCTIKGKELKLLYDTGCSAFGLITTRQRSKKFSSLNSKEIAYDANSWGSALPIKHRTTDTALHIGNQELNLTRVSYVDRYALLQPLISPFTRIGGFLGNLPFTESTLILDTPKEEFLVLKGSHITMR